VRTADGNRQRWCFPKVGKEASALDGIKPTSTRERGGPAVQNYCRYRGYGREDAKTNTQDLRADRTCYYAGQS
jgi:hypothetical protein